MERMPLSFQLSSVNGGERQRGMRGQQLGFLGLWVAVMMIAALVVPLLIVVKIDSQREETPVVSPSADEADTGAADGLFDVSVYVSRRAQVEKIPLETYVRGVVAAEMPIDFELEALKAQAIASRTYIVRRMLDRRSGEVSASAGTLPADAWVTDTEADQVYIGDSELRDRWGTDYEARSEKLDRAVAETAGQILTYQGSPILAAFFSTSNGYTENSEDYWTQFVPYLRSVSSPWDAGLSPKYTATARFSVSAFLQKLGLPAASKEDNLPMRILDLTAGHRIKTIRIADHLFTGREVREKLGLPSSQFAWKQENGMIELTTRGYGHGVGMSQWGADGMAKEGKSAEQILTYYYRGVKIEPIRGATY